MSRILTSESGIWLPRDIRGCMFDDGWEFDAPTILYYPFFRFGYGGNSGHLDNMVEDVCIDILLGNVDFQSMRDGLLKECKWRGWDIYGFRKRKKAWHVRFEIEWSDDDGELRFDVVQRTEQNGPFHAIRETTNED